MRKQLTMFSFLEGMDALQQGFWYVALISSGIFLIQIVMTFLGSDSSDGVNADFDGNLDDAAAPFQLFSFRNLVNFMLGFGWAGVGFYAAIPNKLLLIFLATIAGIIFVMLFFALIKQILKLTEDNTFKIESLKGKTGEVYLNIPPQKSGKGKILISINGSNRELDAMTDSAEMIHSSSMVKVTEIVDDILMVTKV